jgi:hypothetical protein
VLITPHRNATAAERRQNDPAGIGLSAAGAQTERSAPRRVTPKVSRRSPICKASWCEAVFRRSAAHPCAYDAMVGPVKDSGKNIEDRPG